MTVTKTSLIKKTMKPTNTSSAFNASNNTSYTLTNPQTTKQEVKNFLLSNNAQNKPITSQNNVKTNNTDLQKTTQNQALNTYNQGNKQAKSLITNTSSTVKTRNDFGSDNDYEDYIINNDISFHDNSVQSYVNQKAQINKQNADQIRREIVTRYREREKADKYQQEQLNQIQSKSESDPTYAQKLNDYSSGKLQTEYDINKTILDDLYKQQGLAITNYGFESKQYSDVTSQITSLNDRNKEIETIADEYNKIKELDNYNYLKENGSEQELKDYTSYLSHYEDNLGERTINMFTGALSNVVKTGVNVASFTKDKTYEGLALAISSIADNSLKNGNMSEEEYNELINKANEFKNYSAVDDEVRKQVEKYANEINYAVTQGVENPVGKFVLSGLQSTANFGTQLAMFGPTGSLLTMSAQSASDRYFELQNIVDENGNKVYTENQILLNALLTGLTSYATEKIGMDSLVSIATGSASNYVYGKALNYLLKSTGQQALSEGLEELIEGISSPIIDSITLGTPIEYNPGELFYSVALGAFSGGLMGAPASANFVLNTKAQYDALVSDYKEFMMQNDVDAQTKEKVTNAVNLSLNAFEETSVLNKAVQEIKTQTENEIDPLVTLSDAITPNVQEGMNTINRSTELLNNVHEITNTLLQSHGINMDAFQYEELSPEQRQEVQKVSNLARELGADVYFDSNIEVLDKDGNPTGQFANGYNEKGQIVINPNSMYDAPISILSHELVHNSEYSDSYNDLKELIKSTIGEEAWNNAYNNVALKYNNVTDQTNLEKEVVAEYIQNNYGNEKFVSQLAKYNNNAFSRLYTKMKSLIKSDPESQIANAYFKAYKESIDNVMSMTKPTMFAGNILSANNCQYNIAQYKETGRDIMIVSLDNMIKKNKISVEEKNEIIKTLDFFAKTIDSIKDANSLENFAKWSDVSMTVDHNGFPQLTCVVANGEYKLNIDFSTVCKKRKITDFVLNQIAKEGLLDKKALSQEDIAKIRDIVKNNDLEVACSLCFVESKRYNQGGWADTLINGKKAKKDKELIKIGAQNSKGYVIGWNGMVDAITPNGVEVSTFNFAERANPVEGTLHTLPNEQLNPEGVALLNRIAEAKPKSEIGKMAKLLLTNPDMRKHLQLGDLYGSRAFGNIKRGNEDLFKIINSHQGVAKPKSPYVEVTYNNEIITSESFKGEKARYIGGVRIQSFSDYMANMVFDYMEMVAELQAKGLTAQSYTKVEEFAKIFGQTGIKINLSIIPKATVFSTKDYLLLDKKTQEFYKQYSGLEVLTKEEYNALSDEQKAELSKRGLGLSRDGNYYTAYIFEDESYNWDNALKLQATPGYSKNVGTVCVGVSDEHIWKMLSDDNVKMIIPYHSSSLNKAVAEMINIGAYNEYTEYQNTGVYNASKKKKWTSINSEDNKAYKDFDFYGGEKGMIAQNYDAKAVATSYLEYCAENGLRPKFDKFAFVQEDGGDWIRNDNGSYSKVGNGEGNLTINENYYKLLIDFRAYNEDGIAPQEDVKLNFPENIWDIVKDSLLKYENSMVEQNSKMPQIIKEVKDVLNKDVPNRQYSIGNNSFDNEIAKRNDTNIAKTGSNGQDTNADEQKQIETKTLRDNIADTYQKNIDKYGAFNPGEAPRQDVQVPKATEYGPTSEFARNFAETPNLTDEEMMYDFAEAINNGEFAYSAITNKGLIDDATNKLNRIGVDSMYKEVMNNHNLNARLISEESVLLTKLSELKDRERVKELALKLTDEATLMGQGLQSFRILKKLSPELQLESVQKMLDRMQADINQEYGNKAVKLEIPENLKNDLLNATTEEEIAKARNAIQKDLLNQQPKKLGDIFNAWRYLSMLGNPRTHIRNILGNALFSPLVDIKNTIATGIEKLASSKLENRTKAIVGNSESDKALKALGKQYYNQSTLVNGEKYETKNFGNSKIGNLLNKVSDFNSNLMDKEDFIFSSKRFEQSFASYIKSNGYTAENIPQDVINRAIDYATKEAQIATFRDFNEGVEWFNKAEKSKSKLLRLGKQALLPFTKTPMNIIRRGIEYSPLGLMKAITADAYNLAQGRIDANTYIDNLSAGMTGTMISILGATLASLGMFKTKDDDKDRKQNFDTENGEQEYAIDLSPLGINGTYTIDWATPDIMPLAIGAELYDIFSNAEGIDGFNNTMDAVATISAKVFDPIFDTSMLSSLQSALKSYANSGGEWVGNIVGSMVSSYIQQFIPTLSGQIARAVDDTRRTTYPNTGIIDKTIKQALNKIPGLSILNEPYINRDGEEEKNVGGNFFGRLVYNMVSPGYYQSKDIDKYDEEYYRLYESTGSLDAFPSNTVTSTTYEKEKYKLTDKEYTEWNKTRWSLEKQMVEEFIDSESYQYYTDEERTETIKDIRAYAQKVAKEQLLNSRGIEYEDANYDKLKAIADNLDIVDYFNYNNFSGSKQADKVEYLENSDLSQEEKELLYSTEGYKTSYADAYAKVFGEAKTSNKRIKVSYTKVATQEAYNQNATSNTQKESTDDISNRYNYLKSSSQSTSQSSTKVVCPECGFTVTPTDGICPICGHSL